MYILTQLLFFFFFFFNDTATTEIYTLSLHDALPIFLDLAGERQLRLHGKEPESAQARILRHLPLRPGNLQVDRRSEEHTSELQSPCNLVCRLLLEKKKHNTYVRAPLTLAVDTDSSID